MHDLSIFWIPLIEETHKFLAMVLSIMVNHLDSTGKQSSMQVLVAMTKNKGKVGMELKFEVRHHLRKWSQFKKWSHVNCKVSSSIFEINAISTFCTYWKRKGKVWNCNTEIIPFNFRWTSNADSPIDVWKSNWLTCLTLRLSEGFL